MVKHRNRASRQSVLWFRRFGNVGTWSDPHSPGSQDTGEEAEWSNATELTSHPHFLLLKGGAIW